VNLFCVGEIRRRVFGKVRSQKLLRLGKRQMEVVQSLHSHSQMLNETQKFPDLEAGKRPLNVISLFVVPSAHDTGLSVLASPAAWSAGRCRLLSVHAVVVALKPQLHRDPPHRNAAPPKSCEAGHGARIMLGTGATPTRPWALARGSPAMVRSLNRGGHDRSHVNHISMSRKGTKVERTPPNTRQSLKSFLCFGDE
jgi:hypothetical protein